ncbi:MAG: lipopolysaccharide biosynthesis protein [Bacteroidaceae bacterium]|nr:lipopolysaccharide biosynthesis protein [Bacteroidaceae bacterium]
MAFSSKKVINSMIWKLLERFSSQLVSFVISIILARILMPTDYGIVTLILVFINIANVIIDGGFNTALIQKKDADQTDFSTIFWFCLLMAAVIYLFLFLGAPLIASFYKNDVLTPVLRVLGLNIFFFSFNSIQRAYVSRCLLFQKLFYVNAMAIFLSGVIGIAMAYGGYGVWALVGQALTCSIFSCVLMSFFISWHPTFVFSRDRFAGLFDYGWKIFLTNFIISFYDNIRSLVIGRLYQPAALAFFDRGKSLPSLLMTNVTTSIDSVLLPTLSEEQDNTQRVKQMMRRSVGVSYLFVAPLLVGFIVVAKELVLVLLTEKWLPAVPFIQIFCIAFLLMPIQNINTTGIKSLGYSNIILKLEIIKKIIEAVILVVSFMINVYAVAWGIVLYNTVCIAINLSPSKKLVDYGVWEQLKDVLPTIMAALLMGAIVYACGFLPFSNILLLVVQVVVGIATYSLTCILLKLDSFVYILRYLKDVINHKE